jgi:5'-nucleotidase
VAAAIQGSFLQIPSLAISALPDKKGQYFFEFSAKIAFRMAKGLIKDKLPQGILLNLNIPPPPVKGIRITKLGEKRYDPEIIEEKDPRNKTFYWLGTGNPKALGDKDSDVKIVNQGYISVTPLHLDLTDYQAMKFPALKNLISFLEDENIQKTL